MNNPTFEQVIRLTDSISNHHMLNMEACEAMYQALCQLPDGSTVVEVGCDIGRSSSLIYQMAIARNFLTIHVDPWEQWPERAKQWMETMCERNPYHPFVVLRMKTEQASLLIQGLTPNGIDLAYIDGSHDEAVVVRDLEIVATRVVPGGFLTAHDYPSGGVSEAIDRFIALGGWTKENQAGGFGVWRRQ